MAAAGPPSAGYWKPRPPQGPIPPGSPCYPNDWVLPPAHIRNASPEDGMPSVAAGMLPIEIKAQRPCPNTRQYLQSGSMRKQPRPEAQPRRSGDIAGFVAATATFDENETANAWDEEIMNIRMNHLRLMYQCISGWILMLWQNPEEFSEGLYGGRSAPRPVAWFDLRTAFDVHLEVDRTNSYEMSHRITIMMATGNYYFCVEDPEDASVWYEAIRRLIQDSAWQRTQAKDSEVQQARRLPAACAVAEALLQGEPIGDRALAILFHSYNVDRDCKLSVGEAMLMIQEIFVGFDLRDERLVEGYDRNAAVASSTMSTDELFDRAMVVMRRCSTRRNGIVPKDDFILRGSDALAEAVGVKAPPGHQPGMLDFIASMLGLA